MNKNPEPEGNVFTLIKDLNLLQISNHDEGRKSSYNNLYSPEHLSMQSEDFFRSSSVDYFRSSSITIPAMNQEDLLKTKYTSKNQYTRQDFEILCTIGEGAYSKVVKARHNKSQEIYAIKITEKRLMEKEEKMYQIYIENEILNFCNHPNIIEIFGIYEDEDKIYMVIEYCAKGDLSDFVVANCKIKF
jgi:hypothetical protein